MKVLWVFAHPEQESLNAAMRDEGLRALTAAGHEWRLSDLYAMGWKATVDRDDFNLSGARVGVSQASKRAHQCGTLSADIQAEQDKLDWADTVVLQFPLWWYSMPAILKGWFDRVFVKGYAYGVRDPSAAGRTLRYGEGKLAGKRAQVIVTTGSPSAALGTARHQRPTRPDPVPAPARNSLVRRNRSPSAGRNLRRRSPGSGPVRRGRGADPPERAVT